MEMNSAEDPSGQMMTMLQRIMEKMDTRMDQMNTRMDQQGRNRTENNFSTGGIPTTPLPQLRSKTMFTLGTSYEQKV
jgi:hypothetical protein